MVEIDSVDAINDFKQQFQLILIEYIQWMDERLAFESMPASKIPGVT